MIASRLWYLVLSIAIGFLTFVLFLGTSMFDRASKKAMSEGLSGDAQVVSWYMKDDARRRSSALINFALDPELAGALGKASASPDKPPADVRDKVKKLLKSVDEKLGDLRFTALFAVDQYGRVIAQHGFDQASGIEDFELGGYPVVADALHGWVRDDSWVLDGRIYRVVARPVEGDVSQAPAGAIVGARIVDDSYAKDLSKRTGAAVAFFAQNTRVAAGAPEGFDTAQLDAITGDLASLKGDKVYQEKGRSEVRVLHDNLGVVYSLIPGESWDLGAGFAVGRSATLLRSPAAFLAKADDIDKKSANMPLIGGLAAGAAIIGLLFSLLEHTRPLVGFGREAQRFAKGEVDLLAPSKFSGAYRRVASDVNDGVDKQLSRGGGGRKAADLEQVLGPIPAQPAMSAFSFGGDAPPSPSPVREPPRPAVDGPPSPAAGPPRKGPPPRVNPLPGDTQPESSKAPPVSTSDAPTSAGGEGDDDTAEWPAVFDAFVKLKRETGESVEGLTFDKFKNILRKNREAFVQSHSARRVKFTVYLKDGRAALKASPVKEA